MNKLGFSFLLIIISFFTLSSEDKIQESIQKILPAGAKIELIKESDIKGLYAVYYGDLEPIYVSKDGHIGGILDMIHNVEEKAPLRRTVTQTEVGNTAAFLLSDLSSGISGQTIYVDAGYCINGM